ncbi:CLUMA_CG021172, isoform A [Clunio marinus]|uniref:CLUMA_CG021172, isoform A n=1 Tax=Clunio marinus TaxID=568069 RepID=A0A1J1J683_9DIPT|nr:CLUMA_CG021172, isoform A [Clunio marinus]
MLSLPHEIMSTIGRREIKLFISNSHKRLTKRTQSGLEKCQNDISNKTATSCMEKDEFLRLQKRDSVSETKINK